MTDDGIWLSDDRLDVLVGTMLVENQMEIWRGLRELKTIRDDAKGEAPELIQSHGTVYHRDDTVNALVSLLAESRKKLEALASSPANVPPQVNEAVTYRYRTKTTERPEWGEWCRADSDPHDWLWLDNWTDMQVEETLASPSPGTATAGRVERLETAGWLIETKGPVWWRSASHSQPPSIHVLDSRNRNEWTPNATEAVRFARKEDAEAVIAAMDGAPVIAEIIATEHVFL